MLTRKAPPTRAQLPCPIGASPLRGLPLVLSDRFRVPVSENSAVIGSSACLPDNQGAGGKESMSGRMMSKEGEELASGCVPANQKEKKKKKDEEVRRRTWRLPQLRGVQGVT